MKKFKLTDETSGQTLRLASSQCRTKQDIHSKIFLSTQSKNKKETRYIQFTIPQIDELIEELNNAVLLSLKREKRYINKEIRDRAESREQHGM